MTSFTTGDVGCICHPWLLSLLLFTAHYSNRRRTRNARGPKLQWRYRRSSCWLQECSMYVLRSQCCQHINSSQCRILASDDGGLIANMSLGYEKHLGYSDTDHWFKLWCYHAEYFTIQKAGIAEILEFSLRAGESPVILQFGCFVCLEQGFSFFHMDDPGLVIGVTLVFSL